MKNKSKRVLKLVVCLLLSTAVLACSFSVFADNEYPNSDEETFENWWMNHSPGAEDIDDAWQALGVYGIWAILNGMGIQVTSNQIYEWSDTMYYAMESLLYEYLDDIGLTFLQLVFPWTMSFNDFGLFIANSEMVEDAQDFAEWLIQEFNLTDYNESVVTSTIVIPAENQAGVDVYVPAYVFPIGSSLWQPYINGDDNFFTYYSGFIVGEVYELLSGYYMRFRDDGNYLYLEISNTSEFTYIVDYKNLGGSADYRKAYRLNGEYNGSGTVPIFYWSERPNDAYFLVRTAYYVSNSNITYTNGANLSTQFVSRYFMPQTYGNTIVTAEIQLPSDSGWESGDGVVVTGNNNYQHVVIDNPITVANLPAVIQPVSVDNPEIDQFYDFIPSFIEEAGDSMNFFKQIIFRMPDEVLYCIYAVLAAGVIFGFLRILREH